MAYGFGYGAWAGIGTEATYGTPQDRLQFLEVNSFDLKADDDVVVGNSVYNSAVDVDNLRQGKKMVSGPMEFDLRRQGHELFMKYAMGTVAIGTTGAAGTAIQRTWTIPDVLGTSLCVEGCRDLLTHLYHGVKINSFTINGQSDGPITISADCIAEDEGTCAASSASFSTSKYWMIQDAAVSLFGTAKNVRDWSVTVNQNLTADRFHSGSRYLKEPQRAGRIEVSGQLTLEFDGTNEWQQFQSMGTGALAITLTGDAIDGTLTEAYTINCPKIKLNAGAPPISDSGLITYSMPFTAYADGATKPINIVSVSSLGTNVHNY